MTQRHPTLTDLAIAAATVGVAVLLLAFAPAQPTIALPEVVAAVVAFVVTAGRRYHPAILLVASVALALGTAVWLGRPGPMLFASLVVLFTFCLGHGRRTAAVVGAGVAGALYLTAIFATKGSPGDERVLIVIVWTAVAVAGADAVRSRRALVVAVEQRVQDAVALNELSAQQRLADQRLTIARELHDLVAHSLSIMNVQTGAAAHLLRSDPAQSEHALQLARDAGRDVHDELRDLLEILRNDDHDRQASLDVLPTYDDIGRLVDTMRQSGLLLQWSSLGTQRPIGPPVSLAAYRVVQEALTNSVRHGTGYAELTTSFDGENLVIIVTNPVRSPEQPPSCGGLGLIGMRERLTSVGGRLETDLDSLGRFVLRASLPVQRQSAQSQS